MSIHMLALGTDKDGSTSVATSNRQTAARNA
jgi:hypothetical protein